MSPISPDNENLRQETQIRSPRVHPEAYEILLPMRPKSLFLVAFTMFAILNVSMMFINPIKFNREFYPYRGWLWWMVNDIKPTDTTYDVALLGSSLMVAAVTTADATSSGKPLDIILHHKSEYMDKQLALNGVPKQQTMNLSGPGQMPSDALLIFMALNDHLKEGSTVVYGLAPRDFFDSSFQSASDTESYKYLRRMIELHPRVNAHYHQYFWDKVNALLERGVYLYDRSAEIQTKWFHNMENFLVKLFPGYEDSTFTYWDRKALLPGYKGAEFHPRASMCAPEDLSKPHEFIDNTFEYFLRYRRPNPAVFDAQLYFLRKLSEECSKKKAKLIIVNMPITEVNMALLPRHHYQNYMTALKDFSKSYKVKFVDLNNPKIFPKTDFRDGVHMNAHGGMRFIELMAPEIASTRK